MRHQGGLQAPKTGVHRASERLGVNRRSVQRAVAAENLRWPAEQAEDAASWDTFARAAEAEELTAEFRVAKIAEPAEWLWVNPVAGVLNKFETEESWCGAINCGWNSASADGASGASQALTRPF